MLAARNAYWKKELGTFLVLILRSLSPALGGFQFFSYR